MKYIIFISGLFFFTYSSDVDAQTAACCPPVIQKICCPNQSSCCDQMNRRQMRQMRRAAQAERGTAMRTAQRKKMMKRAKIAAVRSDR